MKAKTLIPFVVILAVLVALVVWKRAADTRPTIVTQARLESLVPQDLQAAELSRIVLYSGAAPEEQIVLERQEADWVLASHYGAPADVDKVSDYLDRLQRLRGEYRATVSSPAQFAAYDLQEEQAFHVEAYEAGAESPTVHLLVGKAPDFRTVFVRRADGDQVFVEASDLRREAGLFGEEALPSSDHWLERTILALDTDAVERLEIEMPDKRVAFAREAPEVAPEEAAPAEDAEADARPGVTELPDESEWTLVHGGVGEGFKQAGLENLLLRLGDLQAAAVVDPAEPASWGLVPPVFRMNVDQGEQGQVLIEGGRPGLSGNGYVRVASAERDLIYELSQHTFEQLFPKGQQLFELPRLALESEALTRVAIEQPDGRLVLEQANGTWRVLEPQADLEVHETALTGLATALASWQPQDYAEPESLAVQDFARRMTVEAGGETHVLALGAPAQSVAGHYVQVNGADPVLVMSQADVNRIFLTPRDVYSLSLLDVNPGDVTALEITHDGEQHTLQRGEDEAEPWALRAADTEVRVEASLAADLARQLVDLEAADFNTAAAADWEPYLSATLTQRNGAQHVLNLGPEHDGIHLLRMQGRPHVFEMRAFDVESVLSRLESVLASAEEAEVVEDTTEDAPVVPEETEAVPEVEPEVVEVEEAPMEDAAEAAPPVVDAAPAEDAPADRAAPEADTPAEEAAEEEAAPEGFAPLQLSPAPEPSRPDIQMPQRLPDAEYLRERSRPSGAPKPEEKTAPAPSAEPEPVAEPEPAADASESEEVPKAAELEEDAAEDIAEPMEAVQESEPEEVPETAPALEGEAVSETPAEEKAAEAEGEPEAVTRELPADAAEDEAPAAGGATAPEARMLVSPEVAEEKALEGEMAFEEVLEEVFEVEEEDAEPEEDEDAAEDEDEVEDENEAA